MSIKAEIKETNETNNQESKTSTMNPLQIASITTIRVFVHPNLPPRQTKSKRTFFPSRGSMHTISGDIRTEDQLIAETGRVMLIQRPPTFTTSNESLSSNNGEDLNIFLKKASKKLNLKQKAAKMYLYKGRQGRRVRSLEHLKDGDRLFLALYPDERFFHDRPSSMRFHYAMFGGSAVGKTALLKRYTSNEFITFYDPSLEEPVRTTRSISKCPCAMQILDTGGAREQVQFSLHRWTKGLNGCFLCFDASNIDMSLKLLVPYVTAIVRHEKNGDNTWTQEGCPMLLVACKVDLIRSSDHGTSGSSRGGSGTSMNSRNEKNGSTKNVLRGMRKKAELFVKKYGCAGYVETSAFNGDGVDDAFDLLTKEVLSRLRCGSKMTFDRLIKETDESARSLGNSSRVGCSCCW